MARPRMIAGRTKRLFASGLLLLLAAAATGALVPIVFGVPRAKIHLTWVNLDPAERRRLESQFKLTEVTALGNRTWAYVPLDVTTETLGAIVEHRSVTGTDGIDRSALRLSSRTPLTERRGGLLPGAPPWVARGATLLTWLMGTLGCLALAGGAASARGGLQRFGPFSAVSDRMKSSSKSIRAVAVAEHSPLLSRTAAVAMGALTFALRLLSLRNLPNDHYMHLVWANEILAGQVPGRDFVDPGMPLMYLLSAGVQAVWPTPFADAVLWMLLLAIATACVCLLTARLTSSTLAGVLAALVALAMEPRLYSAPKVLVPAVGLLLLYRYAVAPGTRRLLGLAAWTTIAGLLRHDLGAFNALGVLVGLVLLHAREPRVMARSAGAYLGGVFLCALPYAFFVQLSEGLVEHLRVGLETSKIESHRLLLGLPDFPFLTGPDATWSRVDSAAALFSAARLLSPFALVFLIWDRRRLPAPTTATTAAAAVMLAAYGAFVLRHPVAGRAPDVAGLFPVVAVWVGLQLGRHRPRALWSIGGVLALMVALGTAGHMSGSLDHLDDAQVWRGMERMRARAAAVRDDGSVWPWTRFWSQGELPPAVQYLNACTRPTDRVLVAWFAPDLYYFSRRLMAGGVNAFFPGRAFSSDSDQRRMIARMDQARVPVVLTNAGRDPIGNTPLVAAYLERHYVAAGQYTSYDGSVVTISVRRDIRPTGAFGADAWPCGFEDTPAR